MDKLILADDDDELWFVGRFRLRPCPGTRLVYLSSR